MNLLVLGGTVFLGRHVVQAALDRGHAVTILTRGRHGAALFPGVERLVGDRDADLGALRGRRFDAVIDCSGYTPAHVRRAADALGDVPHYLFVSSISAYAAFAPDVRYDETAPLASGDVGYGPSKARAEEEIAAALLALGVAPWTGLPLWLPESDPAFGGMMLADCARARAAGLATRDARETIVDTHAWPLEPREADADLSKLVAMLTPEREAEGLAALRGAPR